MLLELTLALTTFITPSPIQELKPQVEQHEFIYRQPPEKIEVEATFYTAFCPTGCIGITKMGHDVSNTIYVEGMRVIAVDPKVIELGKIVNVETEDGQSFTAISSDVGADIKGNRIDILVKSRDEAYELGRQRAKVTILEDY